MNKISHNELLEASRLLIDYLKYKKLNLNNERYIYLTKDNKQNLNNLYQKNKKITQLLKNSHLPSKTFKKTNENNQLTSEIIDNNKITDNTSSRNPSSKDDLLKSKSIQKITPSTQEKNLYLEKKINIDDSAKKIEFDKILPTKLKNLDKDSNQTDHLNQLKIQILEDNKTNPIKSLRNEIIFPINETSYNSQDSHSIDVMFIGDAPNFESENEKKSITGRYGEKLTKILKAMNLSLDKVYVTNILKYRPKILDLTNQGNQERKANKEEFLKFLPHIYTEINIIKPKIIVCLGRDSAEWMIRRNLPIEKLRNKIYHLNFQNIFKKNLPIIVTYHPSYIYRNDNNQEKRKVWEDMMMILKFLKKPISDKQKKYFL